MKIIIASTIIPYIEGGGTFIVDWLDLKLKEYGYNTEVFKIPFFPFYKKMLPQMVALRLLDFSESSDLLITIRTPSYLIKHRRKVLWFIHHHRGAYDLWGTKYQDIPNTDEGLNVRKLIIESDNTAFKEAKKIFTNSKIVSDRLKKYNNFDSEVLYPPLVDSDKYYNKEYGDYIFYPSRLTSHKRQHLVMEAMKYVKSNVKLVIAGSPDTKNSEELIQKAYGEFNTKNNIKLITRWISQKEKLDLFANCLGSIYIPYEEDSYGYVTLESFHSKKPVITASDSGGTLEIVKDKFNGLVVHPDPKSIAEAMDKLYFNKIKAKKMGNNGIESMKLLNINWDRVVNKLVKK